MTMRDAVPGHRQHDNLDDDLDADAGGDASPAPEATPAKAGTYAVGYRRPPEQHRFRKGQSGNPRGRPPMRKNVRKILHDVLYQPVRITVNGRARTVPAIEALFRSSLMNAMKGDQRSVDRLLKQLALLCDPEAAGETGFAPSPAESEVETEVLETFTKMILEARAAGYQDDGT